ncbi:MAG: hypothetical protein ACLFTQ_00705 [Candidatus Aenigmatarchaeota archaeon]
MVEELLGEVLIEGTAQPFLPFFFVLAVVFGLLEIVDVFKKNSVNLIISLVFAFFAAGYTPFVEFFFQYFSYILWTFVVLFFIAFFREALGFKRSKVKSGEENLLIMIAGLFLLLLVSVGTQYIPELDLPIARENLVIFMGTILLVFMFFYAFKFHKTVGKEAEKRIQERGG